jgi:hypothetical protein
VHCPPEHVPDAHTFPHVPQLFAVVKSVCVAACYCACSRVPCPS